MIELTRNPNYKRHIRNLLIPIDTTFEMTVNGYVYRFNQTEKGVKIQRTPTDPVLWLDMSRTEAYSIFEKRFVNLLNCGFNEYFTTLDEATDEIDFMINRN